jgi:hypothetical protein
MAYNKSPIWEFSDTSQTGIDKIPLNRLVFIQSTGQMFQKTSNSGLSGTSTVADLLKDTSLFKSISGGATGGNSVFNLDNSVVASDYTIPAGRSATTIADGTGTVTINGGVTVTVSAKSRWVIM